MNTLISASVYGVVLYLLPKDKPKKEKEKIKLLLLLLFLSNCKNANPTL
jgi:hypothetical protein